MSRRARAWKWCKRGLVASAALVALAILAVVCAVRFWDFPLEELSVESGGPLIITDRHGEVLRKSPSPSGHPGREGWVPLSEIPPLLVSSFVVSEDRRFFDHGGVDPRGIVRAALLNARERRLAYGGSTITMQLVRMLRWPRARRTCGRKISEAVLAMRLERALSKEQILEHYLNRAYFGSGAYGVEAASRLYFDKPARALSEGEATLLAVLPRSPASIAYDIADVPSAYKVLRLTQKERGPVRYREALAGSYNLAAVHTLERVGVGKLMSTLRRAGVGELDGDADTYGLRLALGSAKVRLIDLANAYRLLVRDGWVTAHRSVLELENARGGPWRPPSAAATPVISPQSAWLVMDMLSDPGARRPAFGNELPIELPFPVAVKTGTSRGFADTVTFAVTEQVTVAAWAGNSKGEPTQGLTAMEASAPLVRAGLLLAAARGERLTLPARPQSIASSEVCPISGMSRGSHCPHGHREVFAKNAVPAVRCNWHRGGAIEYPIEIAAWARRTRDRGGRSASR